MTRLLSVLSLITYAAATMHKGEGGGGGGGAALPFELPSGGHGGGGGGGEGLGGLGEALGKNLGQGGGHEMGGQGQGIDIGSQLLGDHQAQAGSSVNIVVLWTNQGGGEQNKVMNEAPMEKGNVHQVVVGGEAGLVYAPDTVMAQPGDMIEFMFMSQNHTVTQSTFMEPCGKMEAGFDSGFIPNPENSVDPPPAMMFQVTTTEPVWMYCAQGMHCQQGMVFSVNPTADKSQAMFKELAMGGAAGGGAGETAGTSAMPPLQTVASSSSMALPPLASPTVAEGQGNAANGEQCSCSCLCGMSAMPAGAGLNAWGGMGGSIPMGSSGKRRALEF